MALFTNLRDAHAARVRVQAATATTRPYRPRPVATLEPDALAFLAWTDAALIAGAKAYRN